jgi:hypothetical protein
MSTAAANLWSRWCVAVALLVSLDAGARQPLSEFAADRRLTRAQAAGTADVLRRAPRR